jgi:peroxiredoxin
MKKSFLILMVFAVISCNGPDKSYEEYVDGFEERFAEVESEYESADEMRQAELESIYEEVELEMVDAQKHYIRDHPDSLRSVFLLYEIDWSFKSTDEFWTYINLIDPSLHSNDYYVRLCKTVRQAEEVQIGKTAPDFILNDAKGYPRKLSEAYGNSTYLLLDFWASNCSPCRHENPLIRKAYNEFQSKGFDVFGVSTDTQEELWLKAIEEDSLTWTNVCSFENWGDSEVVEVFALSQTSQNFLLDRTGKIIAKDLRGGALGAMLAELLN